jgi:diguanylate cyclase (GGDEF)-like protein
LRSEHILSAVTIALVCVIAVLAVILPTENFLLVAEDDVNSLDSDWDIIYADTVLTDIDLPVSLGLEAGTPYKAIHVLGPDFLSAAVLRIRSSMQELRVYLDGQMIYNKGITAYSSQSLRLNPPPASVWHLIPIPAQSAGKELILEMMSPVAAFSGAINPITYGLGEALLYDLVKEKFFGIVLSAWLVLVGIIFLSMNLFVRQLTDKRLLYLGLFTLAMSLWILAETRVLQLFTGNRFLIGALSYLMVCYMPIPFVFYLRDMILTRYKMVLNLFSLIFSGLLVVNLTLQLAGISHLIDLMPLTLVTLIVLGAVVFLLLFQSSFREHDLRARKFLFYTSILVFFSLMEIAAFFFHDFNLISSFLQIGIFIFSIFLVFDTFRYMNNLIVDRNEARFFEKMAYLDILTGGQNRNAFERDVEELIQDKATTEFRLILMDMNGLKAINDTYGHPEGDRALRCVYEALKIQFEAHGKCYRVSGDEFVVILFDTHDHLYESLAASLREVLRTASEKLPYDVELAIGSAVYSQEQESDFTAFYHEVDTLMYSNKTRLKNKQNTAGE